MSYLYHYTTYTALMNILETMSLKFGQLQNTNDPKEYRTPDLIYIDCFGQLNNYIDEIKNELYRYNLLCFTLESKKHGYAHPRMWAHYGQNHEGCCILLNKEKFDEELNKLVRLNALFSMQDRINYIGEDSNHSYSKDNDKNIKNFIRNNLNYFLFTKSSDWESESEYRYLIYNENKQNIYINIEDAFDGIYFGHKFPQLLIEKILELFDNKLFSKVTWNNGFCIIDREYTSYEDYLLNIIKDNFTYHSLSLNTSTKDFNVNPKILLPALLDEKCISSIVFTKLMDFWNKYKAVKEHGRSISELNHLRKECIKLFNEIR